jgi:hypothetical protein
LDRNLFLKLVAPEYPTIKYGIGEIIFFSSDYSVHLITLLLPANTTPSLHRIPIIDVIRWLVK